MKTNIRYLNEEVNFKRPHEVVKFSKDENLWKENYRENAWLLLCSKNKIKGVFLLSLGGIDEVKIDIRLACKASIDAMADNVIVMHNHPSNNPIPSIKDREMTDALRRALGLLDIRLTDHIIVTEKEYCSFSEDCVIKTI